MALTETITIINNTGKIITTGKHLVNIFKEAKAAYRDKKDAVRAERAATAGLKRAQTFNVSPDPRDEGRYEYVSYDDHVYDRRRLRNDDFDRRRSLEDTRSRTSYHSERSSRSRQQGSTTHSRPPLTASNLRTLSEVSSAAPSAAPKAYRSPYVETTRETQLSRPTLVHSQTVPYTPSAYTDPRSHTESTPVSTPRQSMLVHRPRSDNSLRKKPKEIDMNLAYGSIPPDLASRVDLDPDFKENEEKQIQHAQNLMGQIDGMLEEAECVQHTASAMITHLQKNPEAAAAVALTLAELSTLLTKLSPAFLGVIKGGSPAIFALLASPQFAIGMGVAVGVTVVMFGGWKIVKRIRESQKEREAAAVFEETPQPGASVAPETVYDGPGMPPRPNGAAGFAAGAAAGGSAASYEEAMVLEDETVVSSIESWRRGIVPFGADDPADVELMSKEAMKALKEERRRSKREGTVRDGGSVRDGEVIVEGGTDIADDDSIDPRDSISHSGHNHRSRRSHRSHHSHHHSHRRRHSDGEEDVDVPSRVSSKGFKERDPERERDRESERGSERGRDRDRESERDKESEHGSERSHRSHRSTRSRRTELKMIEDGSKAPDNTLESVLGKPKKESLIKKMFKKKEKDEKEKEKARSAISVMV